MKYPKTVHGQWKKIYICKYCKDVRECSGGNWRYLKGELCPYCGSENYNTYEETARKVYVRDKWWKFYKFEGWQLRTDWIRKNFKGNDD